MARKLRVEYPGAIYHAMSRGDRRDDIFRDDADRTEFLRLLEETCGKTGWQIHAYCLMPNHFHLLVETPQPNLVAGMKWFLGTYTARFNRRHRLARHLFAGRYKALIVDGRGDGYLKTVADYVHLNPARAGLVSGEQRLREYGWSSWPEYLRRPARRPAWLRVDRVLGEWRIPQDSAAGRRHLEAALEARRGQDNDRENQSIRRGWYLGGEELKQELLLQMERSSVAHRGREERQEACEARAERLVREELERLGWQEEELKRRRKGDRAKVEVARRLRNETTVSLDWIARRLEMGGASTVAQGLWQARRLRQIVN